MDIAIIETVGVGQTELDIIKIADCVVVTLVPEAGDGIQAMKAGLMEIGDIFVVNKSDRGGAEKLAREVDYMVSLKKQISQRKTKVLIAQAENDIGIDKIIDEILVGFKYKKHIVIKDREDALIESIKMLNKDSILLILGKGRETYQLVNQTKIPLSLIHI